MLVRACAVRRSTSSRVAKRAPKRSYCVNTADFKIDFDEPTFQTHKCDMPPLSTTTNRTELLAFYTEMQRIRRMEVEADKLYKNKLIRGFLHLYNGQEAVATGLEHNMTPEDHTITAYRDHAFMVTRRCGSDPKQVLAELCGRKDGVSAGKGGSMHMYNIPKNFYGGNGIVGAQVPIGTGLAFAQKYQKKDNVTFCYYGDGAANQGQVFEAFNMAKLWKLPIVYVCENNKYAMGTSAERSSANTEYYTRGDYVPGIKVDGMDVLKVKEVGKYAKDYALKNGPILLEMKTYRYMGHSMSDPGTSYRTRAEIQKMREQYDPIAKVKKYLLDNNAADEKELKAIDKEVKKEMDAAVKFAKASPEPPAQALYEGVYQENAPIRATELVNSYTP